MVGVFYRDNRIPVTLPIIIAITALTRMIILQSKGLDAINIIYEASGILLLSIAAYIMSLKDKNSFAIGDISIIEGMEDLPITAQVAMQEGYHLAKNIELLINDKDLLPFEFQDNGEMISLGIGEASISALGITLSGKLAFEARRLIYASKLPNITESIKSASTWIFQKKSIFKKFLKKNNFN